MAWNWVRVNIIQNTAEVDNPQRFWKISKPPNTYKTSDTVSYYCSFIRQWEIIVFSHCCPRCVVQVHPHSTTNLTQGRKNRGRHTSSAGSETSFLCATFVTFLWKKIPFQVSDLLLSRFFSLISGFFIVRIIFVFLLSFPGIPICPTTSPHSSCYIAQLLAWMFSISPVLTILISRWLNY